MGGRKVCARKKGGISINRKTVMAFGAKRASASTIESI